MLTSNVIVSAFKKSRETAMECDIEHRERYRAMRREEMEILNSHNLKCPVKKLASFVGNLNFTQLRDMLREKPYNVELLETTQCLMDTIVYVSKDRSGFLSENDKIVNWFEDVSRIGAESAYGFAMSSSVNDADAMVILKAPKDRHDTSVAHEMFIGFFGTNSARKHGVPNFAYVYGGFECAPPVINGKTAVICATKLPKVKYIIYENIIGKSIAELLPEITPLDLASILFQITIATAYAYNKFRWTHYDLHYNNVIIRKLDQPRKIQYMVKGKPYYVDALYVPVFIDYGRSHIMYKDKHYGYLQCNANIFPDRAFPLYDIYKYICGCAVAIYNAKIDNKKDYYDMCNIFFLFFNDKEPMLESLSRQNETYFNLPYNDYTTKELTIYKLLDHLSEFDVYQELVNIENGIPPYKCIDCEKYEKELRYPNILEYFDLRDKLPPNEVAILDELMIRNRDNVVDDFIDRFNGIRKRIDRLMLEIDPMLDEEMIKNMPEDIFFSDETLEPLKEQLGSVLELKFRMHRLSLYFMIGKMMFNRLDRETYKKLNDYDVKFEELKGETDEILHRFKLVARRIGVNASTPTGAKIMREEPKYLWYAKEAPKYF